MYKLITTIATATILTACGGGGDSTETQTPVKKDTTLVPYAKLYISCMNNLGYYSALRIDGKLDDFGAKVEHEYTARINETAEYKIKTEIFEPTTGFELHTIQNGNSFQSFSYGVGAGLRLQLTDKNGAPIEYIEVPGNRLALREIGYVGYAGRIDNYYQNNFKLTRTTFNGEHTSYETANPNSPIVLSEELSNNATYNFGKPLTSNSDRLIHEVSLEKNTITFIERLMPNGNEMRYECAMDMKNESAKLIKTTAYLNTTFDMGYGYTVTIQGKSSRAPAKWH